MTRLEVFEILRNIILTVTDIPEVILARQNKPAPSGLYCTIEPKSSINQRGQAIIGYADALDNKVKQTIKPQIIVQADIQAYRDGSLDELNKLNECHKRSDISAYLFENNIGWRGVDQTIDLTGLQSDNFEQRAQKNIYLMYEEVSEVEINNILKVPFETVAIIDGQDEILSDIIIE